MRGFFAWWAGLWGDFGHRFSRRWLSSHFWVHRAGRSLQTDRLECQMAPKRKGSERLGDVGCTASAEDADNEVSQGRHDTWAGTSSDLRSVFVKGHVADPMEFVFNAPMHAVEFEYPLGRSLVRREAGDPVHRFGGLPILADMGYVTADAKDLAHIGKSQVAVELFAGPY